MQFDRPVGSGVVSRAVWICFSTGIEYNERAELDIDGPKTQWPARTMIDRRVLPAQDVPSFYNLHFQQNSSVNLLINSVFSVNQK